MNRKTFFAASALLLGGCVHPFRQRFTEPHAVDFAEVSSYAALAAAVYKDVPALRADCAAQGYPHVVVRELPETENRYFLATDTTTRRHVISVQGTSNLKNALLDVEYDKSADQLAGIPLHRGFRKASLRVLEDAAPRMDKSYAVSLTGHSLGGAEAVVLAMYMKTQGWKVSKVVTFGQPRVTDRDGTKAFRDLPILRVVNLKDPVPLVPPLEAKYLFKPYAHLGREVLLLEGPYYSYLENGNESDDSGLAFWEGLKSVAQFKADLPNHSMETYLSRLEPKKLASAEVPYADRMKHAAAPAASPALNP